MAIEQSELLLGDELVEPRIFVLEIDGKPTLAFEAKTLHEALELCHEEWLRADLGSLSSNGAPLCCGGAELGARPALPAEIAAFNHAMQRAASSDELTLAFLVELDCALVEVVVDPGRFPSQG
ncbi:hypothetical protein V1281_003219 [Nitrobacteraceae bacterium AZCC 2161]